MFFLTALGPSDRAPARQRRHQRTFSGRPLYNNCTLEVVQRIGYDSFCPDSGVLLAEDEDREGTSGGPNALNLFSSVIDAHPEDVDLVDFKRPKSGAPVMRTVADYRRLNDALFHAGLDSGSQYGTRSAPNRLHFYDIDVLRTPGHPLLHPGRPVPSTAPARSPRRGGRSSGSPPPGRPRRPDCAFQLHDTGAFARTPPASIPRMPRFFWTTTFTA